MSVYDEIREERRLQDVKWGGPGHDDTHALRDWPDYITDRVFMIPEVFRSRRLRGLAVNAPVVPIELLKSYRRRLIQVGALAVAAIESFDRAFPQIGSNGSGITEVVNMRGTPRGAEGDCG